MGKLLPYMNKINKLMEFDFINYDLKVVKFDEYSIFIENEFCIIEIYSERYDETIIIIIENKKNEKRYSLYEIRKIKRNSNRYKKEKEVEDDSLLTKLNWGFYYLKTYLSNELKGDFSELERLGSSSVIDNSNET